MASELQTVLNDIKIDKDTNLLPENLKAGVTCLGVSGTFNGESSNGVKLFDTIEDMQSDETAKEKDLALVYQNKTEDAKVNSIIRKIIFPKTVILDTAVTDYINIDYRSVDESPFEFYGSLSSSGLNIDCRDSSGRPIAYVYYSSSDGLTYVNDYNKDQLIDFGVDLQYSNPEQWNDAIGKFIRPTIIDFEGLFSYDSNHRNENIINLPNLARNDI